MKRKSMRYCLAALICLLFTAVFAGAVSADTDWVEAGYAQVTANTAIRTKKRVKTVDSVIKIVKKGNVVQVLSDAGNGWYKVSYGSKTGYVCGDYFTDEDDEDLSDNTVTRVLAISLTLRSSPKVTANNDLDVIPASSEVTILGERADGWVNVSWDDYSSGYIRNGFFRTDKQTGSGRAYKYAAQDLYIRTSKSVSASNVAGTLKKGKKIKVIGVSGNWYKVRYKGKVRYVKEGYFTNETKTDYVTETIATKINFRSSCSTKEDNVIRILNPNTVVRVYKSVSKQWYQIKAGTTTGYILGGYFASDTDISPSDPDSSVTRVTTAYVRMRSGKGTTYSVVTVIPSGATVTLAAKSGDWYKVRYKSDGVTYEGWVLGDYLDEE